MSVAAFPVDDASRFLSEAYGDVPDGSAILVWSLPSKRSIWCADWRAAATASTKLRDREDVYIGVGLRPAGLGATHRGGDDEVTALVGLVADFDIAGPGHQKRNLPRDRAEVQRILDRLPHAPSVVVATGGGIHCWWLFVEAWQIESEEERQRAQAISRGWNGRIKAVAREQRLDVDSVHDLARVLRVPGTLNHKNQERREVRIESMTDRRYNPSDFEEWATEILESIRLGLGGLVLRADADISLDRFEMLRAIDEKFELSWERKRSPREFQDQSASAYDLSLATYGVRAGMEDQEIADMLIASRRRHGNDLKLREDYYLRTIAKARTGGKREQQRRIVEEQPEEGREREHALEVIEVMTGLRVVRIVQTGDVDSHYSAQLADGKTISFGAFKEFREYETWWRFAFELTKTAPIERASRKDWSKAFPKIQPIIEVENPEDVGPLELLRGHLRRYLETNSDWAPMSSEQRIEHLRSGFPWRDEGGQVGFQIAHFLDYLAARRVAINTRALAAQLGELGFKSQNRSVRQGETVFQRRCWVGRAIE